MDQPLFKYAFISIWPNRIERAAVGPFGKTEIVLIKSITAIDVKRGTNALIVTTSDGKTHTYHVMGVESARDILLALL